MLSRSYEPPEPPEPCEGQRRIGFEIRTLSKLIKRRMTASFGRRRVDEFTLMHGWIIGYVYENRERDIFQKDIEKMCSISRSTATGILQMMEKKGYLKRVPVERDARLKKLVLTDAAIQYHLSVEEDLEQLETCLMQDISQEELSVFFAVMNKMKDNLRKDSIC